MTNATTTSVAGASPEITAPVRVKGQTDSEVLFNWLIVNRYLWMLESTYDAELEHILDTEARLPLGYKLIQWKRNHQGHPALVAPEDAAVRQAAFARLERLIDIHLFASDPSDTKSQAGGLEIATDD